MKKAFWAVLLSLTAAWGAFAQSVSLEDGLMTVAEEMSGRIETGTTIAIISFGSSSRSLSTYVIEELGSALVNDGRLMVVERDQSKLDQARNEMDFNDADEVDPKNAVQFGRLFGAKMLVSGSATPVGSRYRVRIQVLEAQTGIVRYTKNFNIENDRQLKTLMADSPIIEDFTTTERAGAAALNLAFGLGSFIMEKDTLGGGITAALEGIGMVAVIYAAAHHASGANNRYDIQPTGKLNSYGGPEFKEVHITPTILETDDAYPFYIGWGIYAGGAIFGVVRACIYKKPGSNIAALDVPMNIALVSDTRGNAALRFSYSLKF